VEKIFLIEEEGGGGMPGGRGRDKADHSSRTDKPVSGLSTIQDIPKLEKLN
jgi:hypothetical protein